MTYIVVLFIVIVVVLLLPSQNERRIKKHNSISEDTEESQQKGTTVNQRVDTNRLQTPSQTKSSNQLQNELKTIFGDFVFHELKENGSFYIPDVGQWKVNKVSWPVSFAPRKSLRKQVKSGQIDQKREVKSGANYALNYDIWFNWARSQHTRNKL